MHKIGSYDAIIWKYKLLCIQLNYDNIIIKLSATLLCQMRPPMIREVHFENPCNNKY